MSSEERREEEKKPFICMSMTRQNYCMLLFFVVVCFGIKREIILELDRTESFGID